MRLGRAWQIAQPRPPGWSRAVISLCPFWTKPINPSWLVFHYDDSHVSSLPTQIQLCLPVYPVGFRIEQTFTPAFTD